MATNGNGDNGSDCTSCCTEDCIAAQAALDSYIANTCSYSYDEAISIINSALSHSLISSDTADQLGNLWTESCGTEEGWKCTSHADCSFGCCDSYGMCGGSKPCDGDDDDNPESTVTYGPNGQIIVPSGLTGIVQVVHGEDVTNEYYPLKKNTIATKSAIATNDIDRTQVNVFINQEIHNIDPTVVSTIPSGTTIEASGVITTTTSGNITTSGNMQGFTPFTLPNEFCCQASIFGSSTLQSTSAGSVTTTNSGPFIIPIPSGVGQEQNGASLIEFASRYASNKCDESLGRASLPVSCVSGESSLAPNIIRVETTTAGIETAYARLGSNSTLAGNTPGCGLTISGTCTQVTIIPDLGLNAVSVNGAAPLCGGVPITVNNQSTLNITGLCGGLNILETLESCGYEAFPNDTSIFAFYDVTSTCWNDIKVIVEVLEQWKHDETLPGGDLENWGGNLYHIPVHGEKWLRTADYPITGSLPSAELSLCNSSQYDLGGANSGWNGCATITLPDGSTPYMYTDPTQICRNVSINSGFLPALPPGADATDKGQASFAGGVKEAVVICFFDEVQGNQGGGEYYTRNLTDYSPQGVTTDWAGNNTTPTAKWRSDYVQFRDNIHGQYDFFKGFIYPVIPGDSVGLTNCNTEPGNNSPHRDKLHMGLNVLAQVHTGNRLDGTWDDVATSSTYDGPLPENPVVTSYSSGTYSIIKTENPYHSSGYGGLDQYGWVANVTRGTPGYASIAGNFDSGIFTGDLNNLLFTPSACNGTDCINIVLLNDADNSPIPNDIVDINGTSYTTDINGRIELINISPAVYIIAHCFTLTTPGLCSLFDITLRKRTFDLISGCLDPNSCTSTTADYDCPDDCLYEDCYGVCGGTAWIDECDQCVGGTTGLDSNFAQDLCGDCFGDSKRCIACIDPYSVNYLYNCNNEYIPDAIIDDGCCENTFTNGPCIMATLTRKIIDDCFSSTTDSTTCKVSVDKDEWYLDRLVKLATFYKAIELYKEQGDCTVCRTTLQTVLETLESLQVNLECRNCHNC